MKLTMNHNMNVEMRATRKGGATSRHFSFLHPFGSKQAKLERFISKILYSSLFTFLFLLTSCVTGEDVVETSEANGQTPKLNIYVYAPGQAIPTRANLDEVDAETVENAINSLQIWVYTNETTPKLVTYFKTNSFQQTAKKDYYEFELPVDETFAQTAIGDRPKVDVYVLANVTPLNCGLNFDENTTKAQLEEASLKYDGTAGTDYFGLTAPVTAVPFEGLPMSGVLRNLNVSGTAPVLKLDDPDPEHPTSMAKVKLARAVSRIRFVFSCSNDFDGLKINSVTLDDAMIPNEEYLFLQESEGGSTFGSPYDYPDNDHHIKTSEGYNTVSPAPLLLSLGATAQCEDPAHYAWDRLKNDEKSKNPSITDEELAKDYEELINEGLSSNVAPTYSSDTPPTVIDPGHVDPRLSECRLYLRESDKKLTGTIKYQVKEKDAADYSAEQSATFSMDAAGDFSRNHTWIVYSYLSWAKIQVVAVTIKPWTEATGEHELYNW